VTGLKEIDALTRAFRSKLNDMTAAIVSRDKAEGELRDRETKLNDLVQTLDLAAIMIRDIEGVIRFWSKGCEALYGWTNREAVGQMAHDLLDTQFPIPRAEIEARAVSAGIESGFPRGAERPSLGG
jgi:PAS domain-containing protein